MASGQRTRRDEIKGPNPNRKGLGLVAVTLLLSRVSQVAPPVALPVAPPVSKLKRAATPTLERMWRLGSGSITKVKPKLGGSRLSGCPVCNRMVHGALLEQHVNQCLEEKAAKAVREEAAAKAAVEEAAAKAVCDAAAAKAAVEEEVAAAGERPQQSRPAEVQQQLKRPREPAAAAAVPKQFDEHEGSKEGSTPCAFSKMMAKPTREVFQSSSTYPVAHCCRDRLTVC